jgi:hypothetical protein
MLLIPFADIEQNQDVRLDDTFNSDCICKIVNADPDTQSLNDYTYYLIPLVESWISLELQWVERKLTCGHKITPNRGFYYGTRC